MFNRELNFSDIIFLAILCGIMSIIFGCASTAMPREDSNHYKAEAQTYSCPFCGREITLESINKDIRAVNTCPTCGNKFPFLEKAREVYSDGQGQRQNYGPRTYGPSSAYQSDVSFQRFGVRGYSFKENNYGFSELSWYFHDSKVKSYRVVPHWRNTRYHYP